MSTLIYTNPAPYGPGNHLNWSRADKDAVGTARSLSSQVWYTTAGGIITEVYFPDVDTPQVRDLQLIVTDGSTFFNDATKDYDYKCELPYPGTQAVRITLVAKNQPYTVVQDIIAEPGSSCLLVRTTLQGDQAFLDKLHVYALLAPHMAGYGSGNFGFVVNTSGGNKITATRENYWLALGVDCGFGMTSCGFVGVNDGWTDIIGNKRLPQFNYQCAYNGNVALTAEIDRQGKNEFVMALGFCTDQATPQSLSMPNVALATVTEALAYPFDGPAGTYSHLQEFIKQWTAAAPSFVPKAGTTGDNNWLFNKSHNVLLSHEDKLAGGALVASLSIPWGQLVTDLTCGYHMVWPRDMYQSVTALLAAGEVDLPLRGLIFLAQSQSPDGSFHQKFFIDGQPWPWECVQLDEYSFPIILAYRLSEAGMLQGFDPKGMVLAAAKAIIINGPMTQQERWEELEGYSPSTLAANIAALICAADMAENKWADPVSAQFLREHADFLESHLETWCVTTQGALLPGVIQHYIRMLPTHVKGGGNDYSFPEDPNSVQMQVWGNSYFVKDIVDAGFLEIVRYGIRSANDPIIVNTLKVIDATIKNDLPGGSCYYRYNHDHYGQGAQGQDWFDGAPFGVGHPWPLLAGERGHYELALANENNSKTTIAQSVVKSMEAFAGPTGLLPEQVWELPTLPNTPWVLGGPTGSARPLAWAHAEYIKLVRSVSDGKVFDHLDIVANRYQAVHAPSLLEVWNFDRRFPSMAAGKTVRFPLAAPFRVHWTADGNTWQDLDATPTPIGVFYADLPTAPNQAGQSLQFNFYWPDTNVWQQAADFYIKLI
jgi:glucoamylase